MKKEKQNKKKKKTFMPLIYESTTAKVHDPSHMPVFLFSLGLLAISLSRPCTVNLRYNDIICSQDVAIKMNLLL